MKYLKEQQHKPVRKTKSRPCTEIRASVARKVRDGCRNGVPQGLGGFKRVSRLNGSQVWSGAAGEEAHDGSQQCQGGSRAIG